MKLNKISDKEATFLAVDKTRKAILGPVPDIKERTFGSPRFSTYFCVTYICVRCTHRGKSISNENDCLIMSTAKTALYRWFIFGATLCKTTLRPQIAVENTTSWERLPWLKCIPNNLRLQSSKNSVLKCAINFNLRILCDKHLQHQQLHCNVFIDFKRAFDRV